MKVEGVFLYYDKVNGNGRIYTKECAEDIVHQLREMAKNGNALGVMGQDENERVEIPLSGVSHRIMDAYIDDRDKTVKGNIEILDGTPKGVMLKKLLETVGPEGFSVASRGTGTINENNEVEDYKLISFDIIPFEKSSTKGPIQISDL